MGKIYIVEKAFISKDKDSGEVQVVQTQGGAMHKYMVQVKDQPVKGWFSILKKEGNEVKPGDELYGEIIENNWGKPQFNREQKPYDAQAPQAKAAPAAKSSSELEDKLDYIISLLVNFLDNQEQPRKQEVDKSSDDDDDSPVDLSKLDY